jgi:hypothetical protein
MALTSVGICNRALALLGQPGITALVDDPETATVKAQKWCSRLYPVALENLLSEHPWRWASRRVTLTRDLTDTPPFGFAYSYFLPYDYVRMGELPDNTVQYSIEDDHLLSDAYPFMCRYVFMADDPSGFPGFFTRLLVSYLAMLLANPLAGDKQMLSFLAKESAGLMESARVTDLDGHQPQEDEDSWITARR